MNDVDRLCKLVNKTESYEDFYTRAMSKYRWFIKPYAVAGHKVTKAWLEQFWNNHKGGL